MLCQECKGKSGKGRPRSLKWPCFAWKETEFKVCLKVVKFSCLIPFRHPICPPALVSVVLAIPFKLEYGEKPSMTLTKNGFVASGWRRTEYTSSMIKARPMKSMMQARTMLLVEIQAVGSYTSSTSY